MSISDISDPTVRQALELAQSYVNDMSALVHPVTDIGEGQAREVDRLAGLARKQIAKASKSREPGVADFVQLMNVTIRQFEGLALAFGRDKLAQGASLIESAVSDFEKLSKSHGSTETMPQSYHVLGTIYMALGKKDRAVRFFRRAVEAAPDDIDYRRALDEAENENAAMVFARSSRGRTTGNVAFMVVKGVLFCNVFASHNSLEIVPYSRAHLMLQQS